MKWHKKDDNTIYAAGGRCDWVILRHYAIDTENSYFSLHSRPWVSKAETFTTADVARERAEQLEDLQLVEKILRREP